MASRAAPGSAIHLMGLRDTAFSWCLMSLGVFTLVNLGIQK